VAEKEFDETPSLSEVLSNAIESALLEVHTGLPCTVVSYDDSIDRVSVQLDIQQVLADYTYQNIEVLEDIPIMYQRSGNGDAYLKMPIKKGDTGWVFFGERALDNWLVSGKISPPFDFRRFNYSDAIYYPGLYPDNKPIKEDPNNVVLKNDKIKLILTPDGKMSLTGSSGEILTFIYDTLDALINSSILTPAGTGFFDPATLTKFTTIQANVDLMRAT
jgi:hypothetical protein